MPSPSQIRIDIPIVLVMMHFIKKKKKKKILYLSSKKLTAIELRHKLISQNIDFGLNLLKIICTSDAFHLHLRASAQHMFG